MLKTNELIVFFLIISFVLPAQSKYESHSLEHLLYHAFQHNPELKVSHQVWQRLRTEIPAYAALPDPKVSMGLRNLEFARLSLGVDPMSNVSFMLEQEIPYPGKLMLKGEMALKEAQMAWQSYRMTARRICREIKQSYAELYRIAKTRLILQGTGLILKKMFKTAEINYIVGKAIQADLLKAQLEQSMLLEQELMLNQQQQEHESRLQRLLGTTDTVLRTPPTQLPTPEPLPGLAILITRLPQVAPEWQEGVLKREKQQLNRDLMALEYWPDLMLSGGYMNRGTLAPMWEAMVGITLPLYAGQKQAPMLHAAQLQLEEAHMYQQQVQLQLCQNLQISVQMAEVEAKLQQLYQKTLIPQARQTLDASLASYMVGKVDFSTVLENLQRWLNYERLAVEKQTNHFKAMAMIEEMIGADKHPLMQNQERQP